jgi:serine/threonine-protein kinase
MLEMEHDGWKITIMEPVVLDATGFPININGIEGDSDSDGIVRMYVNGEYFIIPGGTEPYTWVAKFEPVED